MAPLPLPPTLTFINSTHVVWRDKTWLYFAGCNYLGLSFHPQVRRAMATALRDGPVQTGASRATTGDHPAFAELERALAKFFHQPAAAVVGSGYVAPLAALQTVAREEPRTTLLLETEAHACLLDASRATGLPLLRFRRGDLRALSRALGKIGPTTRPVLVTDGTLGTQGGYPPLSEYLRLLPKTGCMLVDDAHGAGAVGPGGRGVLALLGLADPRLVQTASLAKALGVGGGVILGSRRFIQQLRRTAPAFIGSTAQPLPLLAAARTSLRILDERPTRISRLQANMRRLYESLHQAGVAGCDAPGSETPAAARSEALPELRIHPCTPVTALHPSSPARARAIRAALVSAGIFPSWITYLAGPTGGFFRFAVTSDHSKAEVELLANALAQGLADPSQATRRNRP